MKATDEELIGSIRAGGGSREYGILYDKYHQKVFDKCYSFVKNRTTAEELTEDIFSKAFERLPSFMQRSSFSSWLFSITYNHCIDFLREKKRLHYPNWSRENEIPELLDDPADPEEEINYENLLVILEKIHPEEKALLLMKYQDDLSIKEIGQALRISEDAAKMRLKRARTRVKYLYNETYVKG
jgi:RNA polymerase sigma factor (sigma-70 family)